MREPHRPQVLFVCVHNAGRSQMAAAHLHHHAAGRVDVRSAGYAAGKALDEVRSIRDDIDRRVRALLAELTASSSA